jgi:hypothetical protein
MCPKVDTEKELQVLGGGSSRASFADTKFSTCNIATMKRKAFKELLSAVQGARPKGRRPSLRLVVSNPLLSVVDAEAAWTAQSANRKKADNLHQRTGVG